MKYQVDEKGKEIAFLTTSLPISEITKHLTKLEVLYPDIQKWKIAFIVPNAAPEKPELPEFDFDKNTLPEDEK